MPAILGQRKQARGRERKRNSVSRKDEALHVGQSIQQQLGPAHGTPMIHENDDEEAPPTMSLNVGHAAMCLVKERDHVWTIEKCTEKINQLQARNNTLNEQLLEMDTNFQYHNEAKQRRIDDLTKETESLALGKHEVEAILESKKSEIRRRSRDFEGLNHSDTLAFESKIAELTEEVESLAIFAGEKNRVNAEIVALAAVTGRLKDKEEHRIHSLRKKPTDYSEIDIQRRLLEAQKNTREQIDFGEEHERLVKENMVLTEEVGHLDSRLKVVIWELLEERIVSAEARRELEIAREIVKHTTTQALDPGTYGADGNCGYGGQQEKRPETAPTKICHGRWDEGLVLDWMASPAKNSDARRGNNCQNDLAVHGTVCRLSTRRVPTATTVAATTTTNRPRSAGTSRREPPPRSPYAPARRSENVWSTPGVTYRSGEQEERIDLASANSVSSSGQVYILEDSHSREKCLREKSGMVEQGLGITDGVRRSRREAEVQGGGGTNNESARGRAVQCWRNLDNYLHDPCVDKTQPVRPITSGGTRHGNCRGPLVRRKSYLYGQNTNRNLLGDTAGNKNTYRRPWTAPVAAGGSPLSPRFGGGTKTARCGEGEWGDRRRGDQSKGDPWRGPGLEATGGKTWVDNERELLEAFGVDEAACDIKEAERSLRAENSEEIVETTESFEGDRIPKAVDDGDPDLPSPDREAAASRAASARALFDGAANPFPRPPQHKVLVREMLSGVGTGATTPPRLSELEAVAAEKASATISATTEPKTATQKAA